MSYLMRCQRHGALCHQVAPPGSLSLLPCALVTGAWWLWGLLGVPELWYRFCPLCVSAGWASEPINPSLGYPASANWQGLARQIASFPFIIGPQWTDDALGDVPVRPSRPMADAEQ
jgi:hypothetical protein